MTRDSLVKVGNIVGYGIVIAACVFVISRIAESGIVQTVADNGGALLASVAGGGILYAGAGLLLAIAWIRLLNWCGQAAPSTRSGVAVYARTQIAKYLPGNVFHLVGRHLSGRALGLDHAPMVCAAWMESVTLVAAAAVLSLSGLATWNSITTDGLMPLALVAAGLAIIAPFAMAALLPLLGRLTGRPMPSVGIPALVAGVAIPLLLYVVFFAAAGSVLWLQQFGLGGVDPGQLPAIISIAAGAWILGFLTPGAAAGIGVREALLIAGLSDGLGIENAALIAIAFRGATLLGDVLFFLAGLALATSGQSALDTAPPPSPG